MKIANLYKNKSTITNLFETDFTKEIRITVQTGIIMRNLIAGILCIFLSQITYGQTQNIINGKIIDKDKNPLKNVNVSIRNRFLGVYTYNKYAFDLKMDLKKVTLVISNVGFENQEIDVDFTKNAVASIQIQLNKKDYQLEETTIIANRLIESSVSKAKERQKVITGGANVMTLKSLKTQRSLTLKDALQLQPGVIIQEFFGANDQPRLNIRGSSIQSNPQRRGVNLLQDGITTNFVDGSYLINVLEPRAAEYIEVFRGANALKYGSSTLGGAMNLMSYNGYNASPFELKLERGGFDYIGGSISSGIDFGKSDLYVSTSFNDANGSRENNTSNRLNTSINFGRRFNDQFESRLYATYTNLRFDIPGPLTQAQPDQDPKQINQGINPPVSIGPNVVRDQPGRESELFRFANKSVYQFNTNNNITFSTYYQYGDDTFTFPITVGVRHSLSNDFGGTIEFNNHEQKNSVTLGINASKGTMKRDYFANVNGEKGSQYAANDLTANNVVLYAEDIY